MKTKLTTQGFEDYLENIAQAGKDVDEAAKHALLSGVEIVKDEMKELVAYDTGNLDEHIQIKGPEQDGNYISAEIGVIHDKNYTDAETARYGNVQEFGSATMTAHPYIRPGFARAKRRAKQAIKESLIEDGTI